MDVIISATNRDFPGEYTEFHSQRNAFQCSLLLFFLQTAVSVNLHLAECICLIININCATI